MLGTVLAIVAPGQGAQTPGFLTPWLQLPTFAARLAWLSTVANLDLVHYGTVADAEAIRDTAVAQPLLVAAGMLAAIELFPSPAEGIRVTGVAAGHSVGEITVAASTGVMSAEQAMVFVRERGLGMAEASAQAPTGMSAVVGGDKEEVLAAIEACGLTPANNNGLGQIVAAGLMENLAKLAANPPAKARVVPLSVAGAFHTEYMAAGQDRLGKFTSAISTHDPRVRVLSNADGEVIHDGRNFLKRLVAQITVPVRWDLCMQSMADLGVTGLLELPPAKTLTGIAKRNLPGVELFNLNTPDQLADAREFVARHSQGHDNLVDAPSWLLAISPAKGEFTRADGTEEGTDLPRKALLGTVQNTLGAHEIIAENGGHVVEWLVHDGDIVKPGQPVARLYPSREASL